ncbi:ATP-dependent helicase [Kurthia zopfii]|uniref:ATP-dependent DNA helicase DinG n=1 Tax=Kurthia zopfii TaxID=1650 RepID=A0A8B4Q9J8_9BACL|nr:ATP-dependent DNA helicase [Kurthia zopfii]PWI22226.1 ATP-dependent helicase [Kurthia zopfii]TDR37442.1 ATP-dependent DNA helicase DinG [Kurthia zopfii]GEK30665.1 ATP-dependent helicase [Kurthia zopfii]STX09384.1 Probable ATP-dependent helicase dinG homolog [Kurthia zopfii]
MRQSLPFELSKEKSFFDSLGDWMGDVLYDELPEKGLECRDEQIFMSYQIEKVLREKSILFAEAGVGTGKTIAYLLPAIAYARYIGKPALIACADETLIDQLVKEGGDIYKLQSLLDLKIDVRLAKSRDQYLCNKRYEEAEQFLDGDYLDEIAMSIPEGYHGNGKLEVYGVRSDYPNISDEEWQHVNYNYIQQCQVCDVRNRCGQTLHRAHYREATDLIICSQDFLMEHTATKESREREGQLPLLPEVSMIVLDEGHLLEYAAQKAMTNKIQDYTIVKLLDRLMVDGLREKTLLLMEKLQDGHELFFDQLRDDVVESEEDRKKINKSETLIKLGEKVISIIQQLMEEFVFESEMYVIPEYELRMAEEFLDQYEEAMSIFVSQGNAIDWLEETDGEETLVIMPHLITEILEKKLFSKKIPYVFSSATLSINKDFSYIAYSLGIKKYDSFTVESPFDYEEVMKIKLHDLEQQDKAARVIKVIEEEEAQTLLLFKSKQAMHGFKSILTEEQLVQYGFEGDKELSSLVRDFQNGKLKVLASYHLWEGLDLPEEALTRVIIMDLPFPPSDPLFDAKRSFADDPFVEVELPFMLLRLQQGMGRLIRTMNDHGTIHLLLNETEMKYLEDIEPIFAVKAEKY